MNRLTLIQKGKCPPDQFRYRFREDGRLIKCFSYEGWLSRIQDHRDFNGYKRPDDWIEEAEDQLCRLLPPGWCRQVTGEPPEWYLNSRIGIEDIMRGTRVLASFIANGAPIVDKAIASARGAICAGCPFAAQVEGCGVCVGLSNLVAEVSGSQTLPSDSILENKSCLVCKCSSRSQIWLPIEFLEKGVTDEMLEQFPKSYCWKRKETIDFRNGVPT